MRDFKIFVMKCPAVIFIRKMKLTFQIFVSHLYLEVADSSLILLSNGIQKQVITHDYYSGPAQGLY